MVRLLIGLLFRLPKWGQPSWIKPGIGNHEVKLNTDIFLSFRTSSIYSFCVQFALHYFKNELALEEILTRNISLFSLLVLLSFVTVYNLFLVPFTLKSLEFCTLYILWRNTVHGAQSSAHRVHVTGRLINLDSLFVCFWRKSPPVGQGLLIHKVSRSHTTTHHSR